MYLNLPVYISASDTTSLQKLTIYVLPFGIINFPTKTLLYKTFVVIKGNIFPLEKKSVFSSNTLQTPCKDNKLCKPILIEFLSNSTHSRIGVSFLYI